MHRVIEPKILYFGTPVVLISTLNENGTANLAPMSSAWWLGQSCMLGLSSRSKTFENLARHGQCVLNLPSSDLVGAVDRLALLTGSNPIPSYKVAMGYQHEVDKFGVAQLTPQAAHLVEPPRVAECAVQLEAEVQAIHPFGPPHADTGEVYLAGIEVKIVRVHIDEDLIVAGEKNYINPDAWHPLIMNFCEFYGLGKKIHPSRLGKVYGPQPTMVNG